VKRTVLRVRKAHIDICFQNSDPSNIIRTYTPHRIKVNDFTQAKLLPEHVILWRQEAEETDI
jgi:hypothetical protein